MEAALAWHARTHARAGQRQAGRPAELRGPTLTLALEAADLANGTARLEHGRRLAAGCWPTTARSGSSWFSIAGFTGLFVYRLRAAMLVLHERLAQREGSYAELPA
ncbi:MAG: hypothetical protein U0Z44_19190 [Kouleothrix sp.]